ncbi:unnamed protein product [Lampetra planeri]
MKTKTIPSRNVELSAPPPPLLLLTPTRSPTGGIGGVVCCAMHAAARARYLVTTSIYGDGPMGKLSVERVRQVEVEHLDKSSGSGSSASEIGILRLA